MQVQLKQVILTSSTDTLNWKSLPQKLKMWGDAVNSGTNIKYDVEVKYKSAMPVVKDGRIDHEWLLSHFADEYKSGADIVALHFTEKQHAAWGIKSTLRGSNPNTKKEVSDYWFASDEHSLRKGHDRFVQVGLHELSHEKSQHDGTPDITHEYHDEYKDITGLFKTFDWSNFQKRRQAQKKQIKGLKGQILALVARLALKPQTGTKPQVKPNFEPPKDLLPLVKRKADAFVKDAELFGLPIRITEGFRSFERQNELYAQGRTQPGKIVTNAKGGQSNHNYGCAIDIVFRKLGYDATKDQWLALAAIGERHGFDWGGDWDEFVDRPHFELTLGYTLPHFQKGLVDYNKFN